MRLCVNSKAMQVKVQREKESRNRTIVTKVEQWKKIVTTSTFVTATAQLNQIQLLYGLDEVLCLDPDKKETDKLIHELCMFNGLNFIFDHSSVKFQTDPLYMLSAPRQHEILFSPIQNKVLACLATCFNVKKDDIQSVIKLDCPITQYGRVTCLEGGDLMIGRDLVRGTEGSRDASFVRVESRLFIHTTSWALFYPVYSTCGLICLPKKKNTRIWTSKFLWPITTYSCSRVTIHATT